MDRKLRFPGGEPNVNFDDIFRDSDALFDFIMNFLGDWGECIVQGADCADPGTGNDLVVTSDGFVFLDGEILKVDAGTYTNGGGHAYWKYVKSTTYETGGDKTFVDGTARQTWQKNRAIPTSQSGAVSSTDLDCIYGKRWRKINEWTEFTASEISGTAFTVAYTAPDPRNLKWRIAPDGSMEITGAISQTSTSGVGFNYTIITLPTAFTDMFSGTLYFTVAHASNVVGSVNAFIDGTNIKVGETWGTTGLVYFNIRIPLT